MRVTPPTPSRRQVLGFSLLELMIAVVIVGILASLAYPSFMGSIRKGRRAEAFASLTAVQQAQERWRANNSAYSSNLTAAAPTGLGLASHTSGGLYAISLANTNATSYEAIATAATGSTQVDDGNCAKLAVKMDGGNLTYAGASAAGTLSYALTNPCWSR